MMQNTDIIDTLELTAKLLELHAENDFKIKAYTTAVYHLEKTTADLANMSAVQLAALQGVGKSMAAKIEQISTTGQLTELNELLNQTPEGLLEMFNIKGIGSKKIRVIWQELGITDTRELLLACENGEIAKLKGFGEKIQEAIKTSIAFNQSNVAKLRMDKAEVVAQTLIDALEERLPNAPIDSLGELRRKNEVVASIQLLVGHDQPALVQQIINSLPNLQQNEPLSSPFIWRGNMDEKAIPIEIKVCSPQRYANELFIGTSTLAHAQTNGLLKVAYNEPVDSEEAIYQQLNLPYIIPEMREGLQEFEWTKQHSIDDLITWEKLKGIVHNHSTYSDGKHSLQEMADYCRELGFEYLGIADHSKAAQYAHGLTEERVADQHQEIDRLNLHYATLGRPFKILKGIEADILGDGSLDYGNDFLKCFDFVVASVHSNLKMPLDKAMSRLITAIENPHTTILGHPTGRLLLSREGYPIDHRKIIDACAANGVVMELNASPYRLDIDWRWIPYCLERGVKISINPDAHKTEGYHDMHYGIAVARKAGLTTAMTFNALNLESVLDWLKIAN
jgi:DNA polymerase (family X)